ncbi:MULTISPECIES: iron-containing alcohol dehydrogenase family protein [Bacillus]|uniref:iron-containing alcohol dehydrogenase family protein n=1 Tax=Bacillus TaxID=1386 RepID=UPI00028EFE6A|nr:MULTISPECIES: iron-containing alcohol dehydrogenase family protein [Bacillus]EKF35526.1 glycerol dehydrogenase [Bacillus xiamenensis]MCW1837286.1 iron-containing alcohol dehydrogenase family protein [Bacillus xiamenensis]QGX67255.1 iron-containing alcohol dehydrogenase [Bacillus sp. ms-22]
MIQPEDIVRSGPNQFISQKGIYHKLDSLVSPSFQSPAVVTGHHSYHAFSTYTKLPSHWPVVQHKGYSSPNAMTRIADEIKGADVIIGIGGGTILDTAKSVADALQIEVIMVPTIPGTCAASTPLSVIYDDKGNFMRVDYHKRSSYLTLIDHTFLLSSPLSYLQSGIGDTLAKWYEAEAIIRNTEESLPLMVHAALKQSVSVRDILLSHSEEAVHSLKTGQHSQAFADVTDTIITLAGTVGGYGGRYGRMAGAHAVHNGLTFIEETHHVLHGQKVAYGILVQLAAEKRMAEVEELLQLYQTLGLPKNMRELGIKTQLEEAAYTVASHAARADETFCLIGNYSKEQIVDAIQAVETY